VYLAPFKSYKALKVDGHFKQVLLKEKRGIREALFINMLMFHVVVHENGEK
jgi:hypothetical protein